MYRHNCKRQKEVILAKINFSNMLCCCADFSAIDFFKISKVARLIDELGSVVILKNNAPRYLVIDFSKVDDSAVAKDEDVFEISPWVRRILWNDCLR